MSLQQSDSIFGTDGIRGRWGQASLHSSSIIRLGNVFAKRWPGARIIVGRDTRESGDNIEKLLSQGVGEQLSLFSTAIVPTPALAYITKQSKFDFGIMISASHNPYYDNGIKLFNHRGEKISEMEELEISNAYHHQSKANSQIGKIHQFEGIPIYLDYLSNQLATPKYSGRLVVDCANGSATAMASHFFNRIGMKHTLLACQPNGTNINANSGSTAPDILQAEVIKQKADIGIAFDGDADRVIFVDHMGNICDGDYTLYILAKYLQKVEPSFNQTVVGTIMSNLGLENKLKELEITFSRSDVGDKHVFNLMQTKQAILGGEASGHTILSHLQTSGDGFLTALMVLNALGYFGCSLKEITSQMPLYPQKTINIKIKFKKDLTNWHTLNTTLDDIRSKYGSDVRIVIRYSGTEPVLRLMIESSIAEIFTNELIKIVDLIQREIGEKE